MEKGTIKSSKKLGLNWKQRKSNKNLRFFVLQVLSSVFSSISGIFAYSRSVSYPATSIGSDISKNSGIGDIFFALINGININGTILASIGKPKHQKIRRILIMVISVLIGLLGFIGIKKIVFLKNLDLCSSFSQSTKYGVHNNKEVRFC